MNHASGAVTALDPELVQVGDGQVRAGEVDPSAFGSSGWPAGEHGNGGLRVSRRARMPLRLPAGV
jgi:hypothetical protein